jgi:hypothetical protein
MISTSIKEKVTKGKWSSDGHNIMAKGKTGRIGQSFVINVPCHENKFAKDLEGEVNARLMAHAKEMLLFIEEALQELMNGGYSDNDAYGKLFNKGNDLLSKIDQ